MKGNKPVFVDLFAGCGGLSLGMEQAGFVPIMVSELNHDAMETYLVNREQEFEYIRKYSFANVKDLVNNDSTREKIIHGIKRDLKIDMNNGELDLLIGGPPCQGYSGIGHRRSYSVNKDQIPSNHLYDDMAFLIEKFQPRVFIFENVRGLLTSKWTDSGEKGEIWKDVLKRFKSIENYSVKWDLIHAYEYGVPQNRPRVIMVGIHDRVGYTIPTKDDSAKKAGLLPVGSNAYPDIKDLIGDLVDPDYLTNRVTNEYLSDPLSDIQYELRCNHRTGEVLGKGDTLFEQVYSKHHEIVRAKFQYMLDNHGQIPYDMKTNKFAQRVLPAQWMDQKPSITTTSLPDDYVHYLQPRILTVREWARSQTFPDWYKFSGKRTTGGTRRAGIPSMGFHEREVPKYTQIGNAVPVRLAKEIGVHIYKLIMR